METGPLRIVTLANGGSGIGRLDGQVVFVPDTFPGDLINGRVVKRKKTFLEVELLELIEPAPQRRVPPCPVAAECGGCQWQQIPYAEQLLWKEKLFRETLQRQCQIRPELIQPIVAAPQELAYRSRAQVKCFYAAGRFLTGFFKAKSRYVVAIDSCPLLPDALNDLLGALRQTIEPSGLARQVPQLDLAIGASGRCQVLVHSLAPAKQQLAELLRPVAEKLDFDLLLQTGRKDSIQLIYGSDCLTVEVDQPPMRLDYQAGSFAQINLVQNQQLVTAVIEAAKLQGSERVLDLFCGMGNFSLPLARRAESLCGVEDYPPSISLAQRNAKNNQVFNVEFLNSSAEQFSQYEQADLLLLDPPRSGAYPVMLQLLEQPVPRLLYVSCDPQTLARDIKLLLHNGYQLVSSQPFDMFPQAHHVESLTVLDFFG